MHSGNSKKDNLDPALIKDETVQRWLKAAEKGDAKAQ